MTERTVVGIPAGFRDVLYEEASTRRRLLTTLAEAFAERGYREVAPSPVEYLELYSRGHQSLRQRAFRFLDRDDNLLALRADFTPAVARIVAGPMAGERPPLRLWYAGSVFRKTGSQRGVFFEMSQVGAELIGESSVEADAELLALLVSHLDRLGVRDVRLHLNHAGVFRGILAELRLSARALRMLRTEIDRKDIRTLVDRLATLGVRPDLQRQLQQIPRFIGPARILREAHEAVTNQESRAAIESLMELAERLAPWRDRLTFDLAEIDDLEYYTGVMCTAYTPSLKQELGKGGRYDGLLREFGRDLPAVGFSLSLDSLLELP